MTRAETVEIFANYETENGRVTSAVKRVKVSFDDKELGEILGIVVEGYNDYKKLK